MWITAVGVTLLGLVVTFALLAVPPAAPAPGTALRAAAAANFAAYRNAVLAAAEADPAGQGSVTPSALDLPPGWRPLGTYGNDRLVGGTVVVWGTLPAGAFDDLEADLGGAADLGIVGPSGTTMTNPLVPGGAPETLPRSLPPGDAASLVQISGSGP